MIRRILVGAAIAAAAFGFSASAASADGGPLTNNEGPNLLNGFDAIDDVARTSLVLSAEEALSGLTVAATDLATFSGFEFNVLSNDR